MEVALYWTTLFYEIIKPFNCWNTNIQIEITVNCSLWQKTANHWVFEHMLILKLYANNI